MKNFLFFLFFLTSVYSWSQNQIGNDIDGDINSMSGFAVSLSGDGSIVAIGAVAYNDVGQVKVYEKVNDDWTQVGNSLTGTERHEDFGHSVALSSDGSFLAIGSPYFNDARGKVSVYQNIADTWTQIGQTIYGESTQEEIAESIDLSADGNILAVGMPSNSDGIGRVRVYQNISGTWTQIGSDIKGEGLSNLSGRFVSLNDSVNVVAIGDHTNSDNGRSAGHVRVYENIGGTWVQVGNDIDGAEAYDYSGMNVSLSSDGSIVAFTAVPYYTGRRSGKARVYQIVSDTWVQLGQTIEDGENDDLFGDKLSISGDGTILSIGAPRSNANGVYSGKTYVYEYIDNSWQMVNPILGEAAGDHCGSAVAISTDGSTLAVGAEFNDGGGDNSGHVRVFSLLDDTLSFNDVSLDATDKELIIYPIPAQDKITIKSTIPIKNIEVYALDGKRLFQSTLSLIDVSSLTSGMYLVKIYTDSTLLTKRIIKQ